MNLQKLQLSITSFKKYLASEKAVEELYKWESLFHFQNNWDMDHPDFGEMYDKSLQNSKTKRLWKSENYTPKKMMQTLINMNPDFLQHIFKDLFREEGNVADRIDRFIYYCDDLLAEYKKENPLSIENNHYQDYQMIAMYLTFRYPAQYTFYDFPSFQQGMHQLGSKNIPTTNDIDRFFKISKTIWNFMEKDEEVWSLHQQRLLGKNLYQGKSLLLVHEFFKMLELE